ncbi:hypothetical protein VPHD148_0304 [Vibrio phage D148]
MASTNSTVFTGESVVGQTRFTVPGFSLDGESVYLNGLRLTRNIQYSISSSTSTDAYDTLDLITVTISDNTDVLEIVTDAISDNTSILEEILSKVDDITVATHGSWMWDKATGILTMYDTSGNERFKFNVGDTSNSASRERRQDLEM